jgi:hypothetical protein
MAAARSVYFTFGIKATELYKGLGFHGGDYEEWPLLGCYAVWLF